MSRQTHRALLLVLVGACCVAPVAAEEVYKWTDEKGVTHYADAPPEGTKYQKLSVGKGTARERADAPVVDPQADADAAAKAAADAAAKASSPNCLQARANMEVLQGNPVVRKDLDGDGTPEDVSGDQRDREIENAQKLIDVYCGG